MVPRSRIAQLVHNESPYRKTKIPKALREQVWLNCMGETFVGKCRVTWCKNRINVFDFQCGHNIPESKGGKTTLDNLVPICGRCNISMGSQYTIDEWSKRFTSPISWLSRFRCNLR
jgi:5-methylcytosine-specific restriction endonuclease McrA